jgi:hypothetical protein
MGRARISAPYYSPVKLTLKQKLYPAANKYT